MNHRQIPNLAACVLKCRDEGSCGMPLRKGTRGRPGLMASQRNGELRACVKARGCQEQKLGIGYMSFPCKILSVFMIP